jgi:hypothetical protein
MEYNHSCMIDTVVTKAELQEDQAYLDATIAEY